MKSRVVLITTTCLFFTITGTQARAVDIGSIADGNWNTGATWTGSTIPGAGDTGIVNNLVEITAADQVSAIAAEARIDNGGVLFIKHRDNALRGASTTDHGEVGLNGGTLRIDSDDQGLDDLGGNINVLASSTIAFQNFKDPDDQGGIVAFNSLSFDVAGATLRFDHTTTPDAEFEPRIGSTFLQNGTIEFDTNTDETTLRLGTTTLAADQTFSFIGLNGQAIVDVIGKDNVALAGTVNLTNVSLHAASTGNSGANVDELGTATFNLHANGQIRGENRDGDTKFDGNTVNLMGGDLRYELDDASSSALGGVFNLSSDSSLSISNFEDPDEAAGDTANFGVLNITAAATLDVTNLTAGGGGVATATFDEVNVDHNVTFDVGTNMRLFIELLDGAGTVTKDGLGQLRIVDVDTTNTWTGSMVINDGNIGIMVDVTVDTLTINGVGVAPGSYDDEQLEALATNGTTTFFGGGVVTVLNPIPEPASLALLGLGGLCLLTGRRRA